MSAILDKMRFAPEKEALDSFMERFGLEPILRHFEESGGLSSFRDAILGAHLKLSPTLSPRVFELLDDVTSALGFTEPVDVFVAEDASINAVAVHALDGMPHMIVLTSSLLERMDDAELRFVLGHELGHLHYDHYRARLIPHAVGEDEEKKSRMPSLLRRRLEIWNRLTEISADRAGFAATDGSLKPIVSAFFKLASGLGPEHLKFDIAAFLKQLEEIQNLAHREVICGFSHPVTPIRVRALQLFAEAGGRNITPHTLAELDRQVSDLVKLMDYAPRQPIEIHGRDCLVAGGLLVGHADQAGFSEEEANLLIEMLLPVCSDPEVALSQIETVEQATEMLQRSASWLKDNAGEERFVVYRYLVLIAAVDGALHPGEEAFLMELARLLGIPQPVARKEIYQILATKLQAQQSTNQRMPGTQLRT
ncbi:MAG: M48 family metallopeptidase [Verrucomicrobiae bacterium]|nr:M48 family metallopeptidase [Verrucomicrobiae bacterium]